MSNTIENYFFHNRNQANKTLYFKEWLPNVYLPNVKVLGKNNIKIAETKYRQDLQEAIDECNGNHFKSKKKLGTILSKFNSTSKVCILKILIINLIK